MLNSVHVAVVGSANLDVVMTLERVPHPGETVMGDSFEEVAGGKGANQAIGAARGATAAFVGCVGRDDAGFLLKRGLEQAGVDTQHLVQCSEPTGRAFIQLTPDGENSIVVMALANGSLDSNHVLASLDALKPSVVLTQLEIPIEVVEAVARWAESNGARFVLNPSPIMALSRSLLDCCDPIILNAVEAKAILRSTVGHEPLTSEDSTVAELAALVAALARSVVVTDGSRGAYVGTAGHGISRIPGKKVRALDTTGAGDEFAGALAGGLALGLDLERAADLANDAAARLVQVSRNQR